MRKKQQRYISYLLRLWQIENEGELVWRASLESSRTGARRGFIGLDELFHYLRQRTGAPTTDGAPSDPVEDTGEPQNSDKPG